MYIERTTKGFTIVNGPNVMHLKPAQGERLVSMLLSEMPNLPDRIKLAWDMRTQPRAKIVQSFKHENGKTNTHYHLEIYIPNRKGHPTFRGLEAPTALEAILVGYRDYGEEVEITEVVRDEVSRKLAEQEEKTHKTSEIVRKRYGMTLNEIMAYVKKTGKLPSEAK